MKLKRYKVLTKFQSGLEAPPMSSFMSQTSCAIGCFVIWASIRQVRAEKQFDFYSKIN